MAAMPAPMRIIGQKGTSMWVNDDAANAYVYAPIAKKAA